MEPTFIGVFISKFNFRLHSLNRCPVYVNLQPGCTMVKDFSNPCCEKPQCVVTGIPPTRIYSKATNIPPMLQPEKRMYYNQPKTCYHGIHSTTV